MGALHLPVVMGPTDPRAPPAHMPLNWPGGAGERMGALEVAPENSG